ncbi:unnamed protein product [Zymoseptoria tritici ST99CH_1E4]|uniref:Carrier domain-containing protein n=1 Tax=Zymoseptoria tritici ST99CH_1E4 TaxID=1276532 RepID=A0A2H1GA94_ZYMTR|nr:unnamed protein product [Zymoseptoria tritici ST99CH_1E4]
MLPATSLPALNTSRPPPDGTPEVRRSVQRDLKLESNDIHRESASIAAFHRFVRLLVGRGQDDVCFVVALKGEEEEGRVCSVQFSAAESEAVVEDVERVEDVPSGFLLDLRFVARIVPTNTGYQIVLDVDGHLIPEAALDTLLELLCSQISGNDHNAAQKSILNYPHHSRPVPFPQEPDIERHPALLHGCFERRVEQFPDRMAIDYLNLDQTRVQYTYREVNAIAERIAARIASGDQQNEGPVAIVMGPSPEMYIAYIAVLKAGRPFCPIPVDAPVERQMVILEDLECRMVITRNHDIGLEIFGGNDQTKALSDDVQIVNASDFLDPKLLTEEPEIQHSIRTCLSSADEDDLAYILYTSGTTGKPKGVQISHLSAACLVAADSAIVPIASSPNARPTRWFQFCAPTFDPSIMEIFVTLSGGGTLCCAERQLTLNDIYSVLAQMDVDVMLATPSLATLLDPLQLKGLWAMGEALNVKVTETFAALNPAASSDWSPDDGPRGLYNGYGPTEAAMNCSALLHVLANNRGGIIGSPLPSVSLIVVDEQDPLRPLPYGCAGELLISGPQVSSRGYLNRPEETAKAFLPVTPWGRAYRTGDRARVVWDSAGNPSVEFLGRISSDQVKLSGRRVELGEIDAAVLAVPEVREALTVIYKPPGSEGKGSEKPLTAVSLVDGAEWDAVKEKIEATVQKNLLPFMRPYRLFMMEQIPRSLAGKLDRRALTTVLHEKINAEQTMQSSEEVADDEPQDPLPPHLAEVEGKLLDILSDILQYRPSPTASLVSDAGLDSLRGMQLLSRVRAQYLVEDLSLQDLLSGQSVRRLLLSKDDRLASAADDKTKAILRDFSHRRLNSASRSAGLPAEDIEKVVPATAGQSGAIASLMRSSQGTRKTYINHSCYHLEPGRVDIDRLIAAIEDVLIAREAYRTTFVPIDDAIAPFAHCILTPEAAAKHGLCRVVRRCGSHSEEHWLQEAENAISIVANTLYRIQIVDDHLLIISLFHGIFDGASLELLMVDIERQYHGLPKEHRSDISFAAEHDLKLQSKKTDDFWLQETANFHAETIPVLIGSKSQPWTGQEAETLVVKHTTSLKYKDLETRSREIGASPLAIWQTAWAMLLSSYSERQASDVMLGSVVSNRFDTESAVCHGPTFTVLPCRVQVPNDPDSITSVDQAVSQVARAGTRALGHAYPSLGLITTPEGKLPYDSLLAFQHFQVEESSKSERESLWNRISWPAMRHDFGAMLEVWPCDQAIPRSQWNTECPMIVKLTFKTDLFAEVTAERILSQLSSIVMAVLERPQQTARECLGSIPRALLSVQNVDAKRVKFDLGNVPSTNPSDNHSTASNTDNTLACTSRFVVTSEPPHRLVPFHGVGELALNGPRIGEAREHASSTAGRSVWSEDLQQHIILTGDIVRMVDHGIEMLGRSDNFVKVNGIGIHLSRINAAFSDAHEDPEDIETLLMTRPGMENSALVSFASVRNESADAPLIAEDKRAWSVRESILIAARQKLDDYMVPSFVVMLNSIPRTASNDVDRKALEDVFTKLDLDRFATSNEFQLSKAQPEFKVRTPTDDRVIGILSEITGVDAASITDNMSLARLGIHSMAAIRLAWRLKKEAQISVAVVDLLTCSSVGQLLQIVSSGAARGARDEEQRKTAEYLDRIEWQLFDKFAEQLNPQAGSSDFTLHCLRPATTMQEALVIETLRDNRSYWSHRMFRLPPGVDFDRLRAAWEAVARDNEILRTSFMVAAEIAPDATSWLREADLPTAILQAIVKSTEIRWTVAEWSSASQSLATVANDIAQHARNECSPIASSKLTPPWSVTILQDSSTDEKTMILHMHHALHDAASMESIFEDLVKQYQDGSQKSERAQFGEAMRYGIFATREQTERAQSKVQELYGPLVEQFGAITTTKCPDLTGSRQPQQRKILRTTASIRPCDDLKLWSALQASVAKYDLKSPAQIISTAFGSVLAEYLESKYVVIGETLDQRIQDTKLQSVIGPLIVTVPIAVRIDLSTADFFSSLSRETNAAMQDLYHMQPAALRKTLGISSDQPLYPALVVFHPRMGDDETKDDAKNTTSSKFFDEMEDVVGLSVEHSLALNIFEGEPGNGYTFELSGDSSVISVPQLELLLSQVKSQLSAMLSHPNVPIIELNNTLPRSVLSVNDATYKAMNEIKKLSRKSQWSGIAPPTVNPVAWIEYHARHHPRWTAVEQIADMDDPYAVRRWTYSFLLFKVSRILEALSKRGIQRGSIVAVHLGRTLESFATIIALFRGGYIYLPLDEELPSERTATLATDAGAAAFITTQDLLTELKSDLGDSSLVGIDVMLLETLLTNPNPQADATVSLPKYRSHKHSTDDGYILFTSGSTGKPKGVRVTNFNLCNFIESLGKRILDHSPQTGRLGGIGKYLNIASRSFDPHLTHMFMAWRFGLAATIGPRMMMLGNLEQIINENSITHFGTVPSVLQQAQLTPARVPSVVLVTVGGEKVSNSVLDTWAGDSNGPSAGPLVLNAYGPTECTIGCSSNVVDYDSNARNIGWAHDSATAIVFAQEVFGHIGKQVIAKRGQIGELCIAGNMVSLGYLSRPEAQAEAFATTTLLRSEDNGKPLRFYRTGDLVRMMADGSMEFLGRSDQQAKVNGQRLELGEVEHFLQKTAEAMKLKLEFAAAVIDHPELPRPRLFTFIAAARDTDDPSSKNILELTTIAGSRSLSDELSEACAKSLPAFMVPELVWVNHIPHLKASGKVDTKTLNLLIKSMSLSQLHGDEQEAESNDTLQQSLTKDEETVLLAIEYTLGSKTKHPSASRSIYELGIDSISAIQLSAHLKQSGFRLSTADVLSHATIRHLAQKGRTSSPADDHTLLHNAAQRIKQFQKDYESEVKSSFGDSGVQVEQILPTMPLQGALLARSIAQLQEDEDESFEKIKYVTQFRYSLSDSTDLERFVSAVKKVLQKEQMLRTCFRQISTGQMAQIVLSRCLGGPLVTFVNSPWATWCQSSSPDMIARQLVEDIGNLPPVRVHVFDGSSPEILLSIHHALFDGDAISQLRDRIQEQYQGAVKNKSRQDAIQQLLVTFEAVDPDAAIAFWHRNLQDVAPCLVGDHSNASERQTKNLARSMRRLSLPLEKLRSAVQNCSVSLNALFQTVFAVLLSELLPERSDVVFGNVVSLRPLLASTIPDIDQVIAPCLNTLPQRIQLSEAGQNQGSLRSLAQSVREIFSETMQHAFVPLDQILKWAQSNEALFDAVISVNMHNHQVGATGDKTSSQPAFLTLEETMSATNVPFAADVNIHSFGSYLGYVEVELSSSTQNVQVSELVGRFEEICNIFVERPETQVFGLLPLLPETVVAPVSARNDGVHEPDDTPWSCTEMIIRDVVCELLAVPPEKMRKRTSFYRLGLDSILVLRMVKLLHDRIGVKLSPLAVLRARCVAGVADAVEKRGSIARYPHKELQSGRSDDTGDLLRLAKNLGVYPAASRCYLATPMQQGMLSAGLAHFVEAHNQSKPYVYRHTFEIKDRSKFRLEAFHHAWKQSVEQVEILRTTFHFTEDDSQPWLGIVRPFADVFREAQVVQSMEDAVRTAASIDASTCLACCTLVVPKDLTERITAVFTMHHAIYDGVSLSRLWKIFTKSYHAFINGSDASLAPLVPFSRAAEQIAAEQAPAVAYWSRQLEEYSYAPVMKNHDKGETIQSTRYRAVVSLPSGQHEEVKSRCRDIGSTVNAALMVAWSKVLAKAVLKQSDVVFGQVLDGRLLALDVEGQGLNADSVVGPLLNTVPIRMLLSSDCSNQQMLQRAQHLSEDAQQHQVASLRVVQNTWRSTTSCAVSSELFQSLLVFNSEGGGKAEDSDNCIWRPSRLTSGDGQDGFTEYPLVCNVSASRTGLDLRVSTAPSHFDALSADRLASNLKTELLEQLTSLDAPSVPATLPLQKQPSANAQLSREESRSTATDESKEENVDLCTVVLDAFEAVRGRAKMTDTVDAHTNLFRAGLDSILAIRLSSKLSRTAIPLTVPQIMQSKTVASMVARLRTVQMRKQELQNTGCRSGPNVDARLVSDAEQQEAIRRLGWTESDVESVLPCLAGQEHHIESWTFAGHRFFEAPWIFKLKSDLLVSQVRRAWDELRRHHAILRSSFVAVTKSCVGGPKAMQVTQKAHCVNTRADGTFSLVESNEASTLDALLVQHLQQTNDQTSSLLSPPARLTLLRTADGHSAMVMRLHHAMYDAWSIRGILRDFDVLLADGELSGSTDLVEALHAILAERKPNDEQVFWSQTLKEAQKTILPGDADETETPGPLGPQHLVRMPSVVSAAAIRNLERLSQSKASASLSPALLLAFAQTLAEYTGTTSPTFGFYHASRSLGPTDLTNMAVPTMTLTPLSVVVGHRAQYRSTAVAGVESIQNHLSKLGQFGQASVHDIMRSIGHAQPFFNAYINLLYRDTSDLGGDKSAPSSRSLATLERLTPSSNTYFTETRASEQCAPPVRELDTSYIAPERLFVDVVVDRENGGISLGLRCDRSLYGVEQVRTFARRFVRNLSRLEEVLSGV